MCACSRARCFTVACVHVAHHAKYCDACLVSSPPFLCTVPVSHDAIGHARFAPRACIAILLYDGEVVCIAARSSRDTQTNSVFLFLTIRVRAKSGFACLTLKQGQSWSA